MAIRAEPHQIDAADGDVWIEGRVLRHVSDAPIPSVRRAAEHLHRALQGSDLAQQQLEQGGLAGAVAPEYGHELTGFDDEIEPTPQDPTGVADRYAPHLNGRRHAARAEVRACTWRSCQDWKVSPVGIVSVTGTTAMPLLRASDCSWSVIGLVACSL